MIAAAAAAVTANSTTLPPHPHPNVAAASIPGYCSGPVTPSALPFADCFVPNETGTIKTSFAKTDPSTARGGGSEMKIDRRLWSPVAHVAVPVKFSSVSCFAVPYGSSPAFAYALRPSQRYFPRTVFRCWSAGWSVIVVVIVDRSNLSVRPVAQLSVCCLHSQLVHAARLLVRVSLRHRTRRFSGSFRQRFPGGHVERGCWVTACVDMAAEREIAAEDSIKVVCRFRPLNDSEEKAGSKFVVKFPTGPDENCITIGVSINFIFAIVTRFASSYRRKVSYDLHQYYFMAWRQCFWTCPDETSVVEPDVNISFIFIIVYTIFNGNDFFIILAV